MDEHQEQLAGGEPGAAGQSTATAPTPPPSTSAEVSVAPSGKRQALRNITRQLKDDDLASPGVQRLILDELERAETQCEMLQTYVERFHEADKRAAVLEVAARGEKAIEILFGVGVGLGGTIIGFAPSLWQSGNIGPIALIIGAVLVIGAVVARTVRR